MGLAIEVIREGSQAEREYDSVIDNCKYGFIQQSTIWRDVIRDIGPDEPYLLLARDNGRPVGALPLYLYKGKFGNIMTSVPQPGPLGGIASIEGYNEKAALYKALITYAVELGKKKECCLLTITTNPFAQDYQLYKEYLLPEYELENFTQYIILNEAFDASGMPLYLKDGIRRNLDKAVEAGIIIKDAFSGDIDFWYELHKRRFEGFGALHFKKELFLNIIEKALTNGHAKFLTAYKDDKKAGGCFCIFNRHIVDYYLMHTDEDFINYGVNYALIDAFLKWAGKNGFDIFNWQSSPGRFTGVYEFKRRWGSKETGYYFFTKILGDISGIINNSFAEVKGAYINHFLLPCEAPGKSEDGIFGDFVRNSFRKQ